MSKEMSQEVKEIYDVLAERSEVLEFMKLAMNMTAEQRQKALTLLEDIAKENA